MRAATIRLITDSPADLFLVETITYSVDHMSKIEKRCPSQFPKTQDDASNVPFCSTNSPNPQNIQFTVIKGLRKAATSHI